MAGFTIPNTPDAYNQNQAEPDSLDFQVLGNHKNAVVSGCAVSAGSGTTVSVASGEVIVDGVYYPVGATTVNLTAYATTAFFDVIVARLTSGSIVCTALPGNTGTNPAYPTVTANDVVLAAVWRPDNNAPQSNMIVDKRMFVRSNAQRVASGVASGGNSGDTHVNSSWTAGSNLASPFSVKVGSTWYNLAYWPSSGNFSAGTITATLSGNASSATLASKSSTLSQGGGNGTAMTFNWSGQPGQPTWLWGSNNGTDIYVYNPSNFSVANAGTATYANTATYSYGMRVPNTSTTAISWLSTGLANFIQVHENFTPNVDNAYVLGASSFIYPYAWNSVWAYSFQTVSDQRKKTDIVASDIGLEFINKLNPVQYKWIVGRRTVEEDESVTEHPGVRPHYGFIAQEVKQVMDDLGLEDFGGWSLSDKDDQDSLQSLRLMEFIAPMVKAIQELSARLDALEAQ